MLKTAFTIACAACALAPGVAAAQEADGPAPAEAVQQREYDMVYEISLGGTALPADPYTKCLAPMGAMVLHFSDHLAWQIVRGGYCFNLPSSLRQQLERDFDALPNQFSTVRFFAGTDLMFKPFYGKTTVLGAAVINWESYLLLGGGVFNVTGQGVPFRPAVHIGGGLRLFLSRYFSTRIEVSDDIVISEKTTQAIMLTLLIGLNIGSSE